MEKYGKTAVFPGGYGWIGEIPHRRLWPERVNMALQLDLILRLSKENLK